VGFYEAVNDLLEICKKYGGEFELERQHGYCVFEEPVEVRSITVFVEPDGTHFASVEVEDGDEITVEAYKEAQVRFGNTVEIEHIDGVRFNSTGWGTFIGAIRVSRIDITMDGKGRIDIELI